MIVASVINFLGHLIDQIEVGNCYDESEISTIRDCIDELNSNPKITGQGLTMIRLYLLELANCSDWDGDSELWECIGSIIENESLTYEAERKARAGIEIELSERKLTQLSMETNEMVYNLAKEKNADALQEVYNRGYTNLKGFGNDTGANRWGEFIELDDYISTFPEFLKFLKPLIIESKYDK